MKRLFDIFLSCLLLFIFFIPILLVVFVVKITSKGPALYTSDRVGIHNSIFKMYKFRTMKIDTPQVATHLMKNPGQFLTPVG
ncbi:MAG: sugar transferase, partial [Desulfobulbaceae bacterium]|nr:sugar transferase [Desulfobulbaceae bacterium]